MTLAEAAKPDKFEESTNKWEDWKPTFLNHIRSIPGRDSIPLEYICRKRDNAEVTVNDDFQDDYIAMAPWKVTRTRSIQCKCTRFWLTLCQVKIRTKPKSRDCHGQTTDETLSSNLLSIMKELGSTPSTSAKRTR